ncbi:MAG: site-specific integrase [Chloroflexi bacterium]|nr:site-specific integrase [Chloroflexota bacterium]
MAKERSRGPGEGAIYKITRPNGQEVWVLALSKTVGGKRERTVRYFPTFARANREATKLKRALDTGGVAPGERPTVAQHMRGWLESVRGSLRPRSWVSYEEIVRLHIIPALGDRHLDELTRQDIEALMQAKVRTGKSPRRADMIRKTLGVALGSAMSDNLLSRNVARLTRPPKQKRREMRIWPRETVTAFLTGVRGAGDRYAPLYQLALETGMRQGEILGLHWDDVAFDRGLMRVARSLERVPGGGLVESEPKTSGSRRTLTIEAGLVKALREWQAAQLAEARAAGPVWNLTPYVFTAEGGTSIDASNLTRRFQRTVKALGLPVIRFHDMRHTNASLLLAAGVPITTVSARLGHASAVVTLGVYGHLIPASEREAAGRIASMLGTAT